MNKPQTPPPSLELEIGGHQIRVEYDYSPGRPGRYSGPPEHCYPDDPEEFGTTKVELFVGPTPVNPASWLDITALMDELGGLEALDEIAYEAFVRERDDTEAAEAELEREAREGPEFSEELEREWEARRTEGGWE